MDVIEKLRGEFDVMKDMERAREEECEELRAKCEAAMTEFEKNPIVVALREKISTLSTEVKEHKDRREVVSKVVPYAAMELVHSDHMGSLVGKLVSSAILYGRCRAYEQVADMKEPFDLSKVKGYHSSYKKDHIQASNDLATATFPWLDEFVVDPSASIEALLSKKSPSFQRHAPSRTQFPCLLLKELLHPRFQSLTRCEYLMPTLKWSKALLLSISWSVLWLFPRISVPLGPLATSNQLVLGCLNSDLPGLFGVFW
ncbi:hypothetical protein Tco_0821772 [Tanacetum coccineum]|uniref:Uncharacterized protein n=1 Tax=Tanacetum coccineum TaxID=301880 RepID=A0ABQ5AHI8_9ASTR